MRIKNVCKAPNYGKSIVFCERFYVCNATADLTEINTRPSARTPSSRRDERRARVYCSNARAQKKFARAFFVINSCRPATTSFIFARTINRCRRLLLFSALGPHLRAIDFVMSLSNVDATAPAASLIIWRLGSAQLQEFAKRVISNTMAFDEETRLCHRHPRVASTNCQSKKSIVTLIMNVITKKALQR